MNQKGRDRLSELKDEIEQMQSEEQEKYDNAPEGLECSERYERILENADQLQEAIDILEEVCQG